MHLYRLNNKDYNIDLIEYIEPVQVKSKDVLDAQRDYIVKGRQILKDMKMDRVPLDGMLIYSSGSSLSHMSDNDIIRYANERNREYVAERLGPYPDMVYETFYDIHLTTGTVVRVSKEEYLSLKEIM